MTEAFVETPELPYPDWAAAADSLLPASEGWVGPWQPRPHPSNWRVLFQLCCIAFIRHRVFEWRMLRTDEMNGPRVLTPLHTIFPHPRAPLHISWFHLCFSFSHLACKKKNKKKNRSFQNTWSACLSLLLLPRGVEEILHRCCCRRVGRVGIVY